MSVSLAKGQDVAVSAPGGGPLTAVALVLSWSAAAQPGRLAKPGEGAAVDLDASCLLLDAGGQMVDAVWFNQLRSRDGALRHAGDDRTGAADGERIEVALDRVDARVVTLVFTVSSFSGQPFDQVGSASCRLLDEGGGELARYDLAAGGPHTAQLLTAVVRGADGWRMRALGEPVTARNVRELAAAARPLL